MLLVVVAAALSSAHPASARSERLVALARLDAAVHYFHPSVATRASVWDSQFAANALRIADAADSRTYGTLVSSMMLQAIPTSAPARRADHRTPPHGVLRPPSARKTRSQPIALTEAQRGWVMNVLKHGYLREYEAAYRAGRISNYPLLPSERMVRGLAKWRDAPRPLSRDAALEMFYHLEAVAGVEHEPGRGWNGVRRIAADLVEYLETDERVQDSGLANSKGTRHSRYQEKQRPSILARASDTRVRMRGGPAPVVAAPASTDAMIAALRAAGISLTDVQLAALGTVLTSDDEPRNGTDLR